MSQAASRAWSRFNSEVPDLSVAFLSYHYVLAAEKSFPDVRVCRVRSDGRSVLFFPFQFKSSAHRWFGIGERLAGEMSDYFGIVGDKAVQIDPQALLRLSGLRALPFTHLDEGQCAFGLSGEAPRAWSSDRFCQRRSCFLAGRRTLDKKFVGDTERRERNLEYFWPHPLRSPSTNRVSISRSWLPQSGNNITEPMWETTRWELPPFRFCRSLSKTAHPLCSGMLSTLYAGDTWVASHFGLTLQSHAALLVPRL